MKSVINTKTVIAITLVAASPILLSYIAVSAEIHPLAILFSLIPAFIIIAAVVYYYYQIRILLSIPDIQAPDRKIAVITGFLHRNTFGVNLPFYRDARQKMLSMLAVSYASKGDYVAAYRTSGEAWRFLPKNFAVKTTLKGEEAAIYYDRIEILIHLGRFEAAEDVLRELCSKTFRDKSGFFLSKLAQSYFSVYTDDVAAALESIQQARSYLSDESIQKGFPLKDFKYELFFLEAKALRHKGKSSESHALLTSIVHGSRNYELIRLSREELGYWTTRF
ncbi:MAG: hypothetical protein FWG70_08570 [Oscillospiraceae bacterium]|nr:hypothetical protein [Oscillospiraceae bacterium]